MGPGVAIGWGLTMGPGDAIAPWAVATPGAAAEAGGAKAPGVVDPLGAATPAGAPGIAACADTPMLTVAAEPWSGAGEVPGAGPSEEEAAPLGNSSWRRTNAPISRHTADSRLTTMDQMTRNGFASTTPAMSRMMATSTSAALMRITSALPVADLPRRSPDVIRHPSGDGSSPWRSRVVPPIAGPGAGHRLPGTPPGVAGRPV